MRIVLDTNLLARPFLSRQGPVVAILQEIEAGHHELVLSPFILAELERVLRYERLQRVHQQGDEAVRVFCRHVAELATVIVDPHQAATVTADRDDDFVVAAAVSAQADVLGTLDRHLQTAEVRAYCQERNIRILTDIELLGVLRSQ